MMETIKVNMTPCEDVQTIHASQNDNEAREWGFELHNNGEKIDSSSISDQLVFKAYEGGTEEILPTNGSTPTTSPFKGDIKYPQGLLSDQEFLYRESPTEEDGNAKIKSLYGKTLVWNQLVQNGNFADTSIWQASNTSFSVSSNVATIVPSASFGNIAQQKQFTANHKYFATCELKLTSAVNTVSFRPSSTTTLMAQANTNWQKLSTVFTVANSGNQYYPRVTDSRSSGWDAIQIRNCMLIDLTQMGLDSITSVDEFTALFPKSYYDYCQGAMLSFGGRNVKFNQIVQNGNFADVSAWNRGTSNTSYTVSGNVATVTTSADGNNYISQLYNGTVGHKYLFTVDYKTSYVGNVANLYYGLGNKRITVDSTGTNNWVAFKAIVTAQQDPTTNTFHIRLQARTTSDTFQFRNCMLIDLTEMFGAGNEPSAEGFLELFPNSYYEYTTGQYMNIGQPMSLKTTGKNLLKLVNTSGTYNGITYSCVDNVITLKGTANGVFVVDFSIDGGYLRLYPRFQYTKGLSPIGTYNDVQTSVRGQNASPDIVGFWTSNALPSTMSNLDADAYYFRVQINNGVSVDCTLSVQLEISNVATDFEPYTESTLSIPLDEFPNGMDGIGNIFDEKTENKTIQRLVHYKVTGEENVDRWVDNTSTVFSNHYGGVIDIPSLANCMYGGNMIALASKGYQVKFANENKTIYLNSGGKLAIIDDSYTTQSAWINGIKGLEVVFALRAENYIETSFTTASLVTENGEVALANENGVLVGKCNSDVSADAGFIEGKIKLADEDGECYSSKIQLHIERSPQ